MRYVSGSVLRSAREVRRLAPEERRQAGESLIDVLAVIHEVDVDAVGLGEIAPREGYMARQVGRWFEQYNKSGSDRSIGIEQVYKALQNVFPSDSSETVLVHGDFRLDNCIFGAKMHIAAVLDWELSTLGDPLADLGMLLAYWNDPEDSRDDVILPATAVDGFPRRAELVDRYADRSGRDLGSINVYVAFAYWKLACIVAGVYGRYKRGAMGDDGIDLGAFASQIHRLARRAEDTLQLN